MLRPKQVGPYPGEWNIGDNKAAKSQWYKWTGEHPRPILAGEYYLSGSTPQAYKAYADLAGPYFPAVPIVLEACAGCAGKGKGEAGNRIYVLSGHRRVLAAKKLGMVYVSAVEADVDPNDPQAVESYLVEMNRQRIKTPEQIGREFKELWRIQKDLAKQRERIRKSKVTQENFPESSEVTRENFPQSPNINNQKEISTKSKKSRDIAAESLAMSGRQAEKLLAVIDAADAGNDVARTLLDSLNSRAKSIDAAHKELTGKGKVESRA